MISEVVKICGLDNESIRLRLTEFLGRGVYFEVEEECLDAKIFMNSAGTREDFDAIKAEVYNEFSDYVYATEDVPLHIRAAELLKINGRILAVAESLTGGEVCSRLASVSGISQNFYEGIVCYNRNSKSHRLHISKTFLAEHGTISKQTAIAMVRGLLLSPVDIGLSTTGLAGPEGEEGKPVGLVYIAVGSGDFILGFEKRFKGSRNEIRTMAANHALFYLIRYLRGDILML